MNRKYWFLILIAALIISCKSKEKKEDGPFRGKLNIYADSAIKPLVEEEIAGFTLLYNKAEIVPTYSGQSDVYSALLDNKVSLIIGARPLDTLEKQYFAKQQLFPDVFHIATDAIVLITSKSNIDTLLSDLEMKEIASGRWTNWTQVPGPFAGSEIDMVFDTKKSGMVAAMQAMLQIDSFGAKTFAVDSTWEAIEYVNKHPNALGIIGYNTISNMNIEQMSLFKSKVNIVYVSKDKSKDFYSPDQSNIATGSYPFVRKLYAISREAKWGLASSFLTYINGEKGQRILLKAGLIPASNPGREVIIRQ